MPRLTRRDFVRFATAAGCASCLPRRAAGAERPNVLFLAVDDLRPELGCYGRTGVQSPNLDALAASGMLFRRAYCQQAVCAPSRASLLSGCRPDTTRIHDLETPLRTVMPDVLTLPQHFRQNGYTTLARGKIYHHGAGEDPAAWSERATFPKGEWKGRGYLDPASQAVVERMNAVAGGQKKKMGLGPAYERPDVPDSSYADGLIADQGIADLRRLAEQPFFLALGFLKPHLPFCAPKRYWDRYDPARIDLADNPFAPQDCPPIALHTWGELRSYADLPATGPLSDDQARTLIHGYLACVSYVDAQIGRVLAELDRLKLADRTVVVLWGDHGWNLGEHGLWCKHANFETSVHSPLFLRAPGHSRPGTTTDALTEFVDVYPTLCELCGLELPAHLEGTSAVPLLRDPTRPWKRAAFSQYPRGRIMGYSLRTDRYRYTRWQDKEGQATAAELYDHQTDPGENVNLAAHPDRRQTVAELDAIHAAGWRGARPA